MRYVNGLGKTTLAGLKKFLIVISAAAVLSACGGESDDGTPAAISTPSGSSDLANQSPEISGVPQAVTDAGQDYSFVPAAKDADSDFLEFSIVNKPSWAQFSAETGALTGTPADSDVGETSDITITVSDGRDQRSVGPFNILIRARDAVPPTHNNAPTISGTPASSVDVAATYSFTPTAADADSDKLRFSVSNRPSWA